MPYIGIHNWREMKPEIYCMELSARATRVLAENGILSLSQIEAMTGSELLRLPGCGSATLINIRIAAQHFAVNGCWPDGICNGYCESARAEAERKSERKHMAKFLVDETEGFEELERLLREAHGRHQEQERLEEESRRPISIVYVQGK